jgi:hypothetical protein
MCGHGNTQVGEVACLAARRNREAAQPMPTAMKAKDDGNDFRGALAKLTIGSLEAGFVDLFVEAQYNPKELQLTKPVPWTEHKGGTRLEFNHTGFRTTSVELLFDGVEQLRSVQPIIDKLEKMSSPVEAGSSREERRRPHRCVATWGSAGIPPLRCVIESLDTKYTMFGKDGKPLRATCVVKLKEAAVFERAPDAARDERRIEALGKRADKGGERKRMVDDLE